MTTGNISRPQHFSPDQIKDLHALIDRRLVKIKPGGQGSRYVEGYEIINQLNRIFGVGSWSRSLLYVQVEEFEANSIPYINYCAGVKLVVNAPDGTLSSHEDEGICTASPKKGSTFLTAESRDTARKGAITDALKRCARAYGEQFGASLYDKEWETNRKADEKATTEEQNNRDRFSRRVETIEGLKINAGEEYSARKSFLETVNEQELPTDNMLMWPSDTIAKYGRHLTTLPDLEVVNEE